MARARRKAHVIKRRPTSLWLIILALSTASAGSSLAATAAVAPKNSTAPVIHAPPAGVQPASPPRLNTFPGTPGMVNTTGPRYVAPTDNLTAVANAIELRHKSLTLLLTVKPALVLTNPVSITVTYSVPADSTPDHTGFKQYVQSYVASTGNRFLFSDAEGDGAPRRMHFNIFLLEPKPGGGTRQGWSYNIPIDVDLDPIYDVSIGPLEFTLNGDCDLIGDSEIRFEWFSPEGQDHLKGFNSSNGQTNGIGEFAWSRAEINASANLQLPNLRFWDVDAIGSGPSAFKPSNLNLVWGRRQVRLNPQEVIVTTLKEATGQGCGATTRYLILYKLRSYPFL